MTYGGGLVLALPALGLRGGHKGQVLDHLGKEGDVKRSFLSSFYLLCVFCFASTGLAGTEDGLVLTV